MQHEEIEARRFMQVLLKVNTEKWLEWVDKQNGEMGEVEKIAMYNKGGDFVAMTSKVGKFAVRREWASQEELTVCTRCVASIGSSSRKNRNMNALGKQRENDRKFGFCAACNEPFAETLSGMLEVPYGIPVEKLCEWLGASVRNAQKGELKVMLLDHVLTIAAVPAVDTDSESQGMDQKPVAVKQEEIETESEPEEMVGGKRKR